MTAAARRERPQPAGAAPADALARQPLASRARWLTLAALVAACSPSSPGPSPPGVGSGDAAATAAAPQEAPRPLRGEPSGGSPRRADLRWQRALAGDPLDVRALAEAEGAAGLLEGVEDGGDLFRVACEALPFAPDRDVALGRLAEVALLPDDALSEAAVAAIHGIAAAPPSFGEPLDPEGVAAAAAAVLTLASRQSLPPDRRARAISAARVFAERGALDPDRIPDDLDPPPGPITPP